MIYKNPHGDVFAFGSFRLDISTKGSALAKQISKEKTQHGEYVAIQGKGQHYHVLFNQNKGIAAGEYLKNRLNEKIGVASNNILYFEACDECALIVLIINGKVAADIITDRDDLNSVDLELALANVSTEFDLIINGFDEGEVASVVGNKTIGSIHEEIEFIFSERVDVGALSLTSSSEALKKFGGSGQKNIVYVLLLALIGGGFYYNYYLEQQKKLKSSRSSIYVDPFAQYRTETSSSSIPSESFSQAFDILFTINGLGHGWEFSEINVTDKAFVVKFAGQGGSLSDIEKSFNSFTGISVKLINNEVVLNGNLEKSPRKFPYVIYKLKSLEESLYQQMVLTYNYKLSNMADGDKGTYLARQYDLQIGNASVIDFENLSRFFVDMPAVVNTISIKPDDFGFQISTNFSLIGSK